MISILSLDANTLVSLILPEDKFRTFMELTSTNRITRNVYNWRPSSFMYTVYIEKQFAILEDNRQNLLSQ